MSPFSAPVLGLGALMASPALYASLVEGTMPLETAATRLLAAVLVTWLGLTLLTTLLQSTSNGSRDTEVVTPRSLPAVDGPIPVRPASLDPEH